jgi:hypothetical protein
MQWAAKTTARAAAYVACPGAAAGPGGTKLTDLPAGGDASASDAAGRQRARRRPDEKLGHTVGARIEQGSVPDVKKTTRNPAFTRYSLKPGIQRRMNKAKEAGFRVP